jgi:hypothetical protein
MRKHIEHLSTDDLPWQNLSPGVYAKILNHNEVDGDRTGLFRFAPDEGAMPPSVCHYHSVSEELFILDGKMTFDGETWLGRHSYVFHPPFLVHGFASSVPVETIFLARAPAELDFNFPEPPEDKRPFTIGGNAGNRDLAYLNTQPEDQWPTLRGPAGKTIGHRLMLSHDRETGEGSSLVRFDAGLKVPMREHGYDTFNEGFVLEGRVEAEDGTVWRAGDYWHRHPGRPVAGLRITEPTLVFSSTGPIPG